MKHQGILKQTKGDVGILCSIIRQHYLQQHLGLDVNQALAKALGHG